jgi:hypothetical protein
VSVAPGTPGWPCTSCLVGVVVLVQQRVQGVYLYVQASPTGKDCMLYTCTKAHVLGLRRL